MNTNEFMNEITKHLPPGLPPADNHFLERYLIVLGSGPYYQKDVAKAISLLQIEFVFLSKFNKYKNHTKSIATPPAAISQIIIIHNSDAEQCHKIRLGLFQTGLINFAGPVYINFSPFTRRDLTSLPPEAFSDADYQMESSVFEKSAANGEIKPFGYAINPVFYVRDIKPTLVQLYFLLHGKKQPDLGPAKTLPVPLYQAFLNVDSSSAEAIMDFMNIYKVYLFPLSIDLASLGKYISAGKTPPMGIVSTKDQLTKVWAKQQKRMLNVLKASTQGKLGQLMFPPVFPLCENAVVEWGLISGYFEAGLNEAQLPEQARAALIEFNKAGASDLVPVKRYYGWDSYMWAELAEDIFRRKAAIVCQNCGRVISPGKHGGRVKQFCSKEENLACFHERNAKEVRTTRKKY